MKTCGLWFLLAVWSAPVFAVKIPVRILFRHGHPQTNYTATLEIVPPHVRVAQIHDLKLAPKEDQPKKGIALPTALTHELIEGIYNLSQLTDRVFCVPPRENRREMGGYSGFDDDEFGGFDDDDFGFGFSRMGKGPKGKVIQPFRIVGPKDEAEEEQDKAIFQIYLNKKNEVESVSIVKYYETPTVEKIKEQTVFELTPTVTVRGAAIYDSNSDIQNLVLWEDVLARYRKGGGDTFLVDFSIGWKEELMGFQAVRIPLRLIEEGTDYYDMILEPHLKESFTALLETPNSPVPVTFPPGITPPRSFVEALGEVLGPEVPMGPPTVKVPLLRIPKKFVMIPKTPADYEKAVKEISKYSSSQVTIPGGDDRREIAKAYPRLALYLFTGGHVYQDKRKELTFLDVLRLGKFMHPDRMKDCGWLVAQQNKKQEEPQ